MKNKNYLQTLSEMRGISGFEKNVRQFVTDELAEVVGKENISYDHLGSVISRLGSHGPKVMLAGHMDEVGLMVTKISEDGYLSFQTIGGWWSQVMLAQEWVLETSTGKLVYGVTGSMPPHLMDAAQASKVQAIDGMYIDIGVSSKKEAEALGVQVGDPITPLTTFRRLANGDFLLGKAWDNRFGVAVVLEVMRQLAKEKLNCQVYGVATVQEEVGLRGATTAANVVLPDIAFALDVTIARDYPGADKGNKMGAGPCLMVYDSTLIGHPGLRRAVVKAAEKAGIPFQIDYLARGGTDAGAMSLAGSGAVSMFLSIPARYIHSHTSIISERDYQNTVKLLVAFLKELTPELFKEITEC